MSSKEKLLQKILSGSRNVRFGDMVALVNAFGFRLSRTKGSHHIFTHPGIPELVNLQEVHGQAKPYQIKQFLNLIERYNLKMED
jgi:predicted RNA binding protein YcfA (HicA-like mRNA interferase family)